MNTDLLTVVNSSDGGLLFSAMASANSIAVFSAIIRVRIKQDDKEIRLV